MSNQKPARWTPGRYVITETEIRALARVVTILTDLGWTVTAVEKTDKDSLSDFTATVFRGDPRRPNRFESALLAVNTTTGRVAEVAS